MKSSFDVTAEPSSKKKKWRLKWGDALPGMIQVYHIEADTLTELLEE